MQSESNGAPPKVSIGLPVRNSVSSIESAISSALAQDYPNFELIISDNASDDGTSELCRRWAAKDSRVRYVRLSDDIGAVANFRAVLNQASGVYFAWLGSDDVLSSEFLRLAVGTLEDHPTMAGCSGLVEWAHGELAPGTFAIVGAPRRRVSHFLRHARDNSRFYGLFRRQVLLKWFPPKDFYAFDIGVMVGTLIEGEHGCIGEILLRRARSDPSRYVVTAHEGSSGWLNRWFPLLPLTQFLLRASSLNRAPSVLWWLLVRNLFDAYRLVVQRTESTLVRRLDGLIERIRKYIVSQ